ncbi:TIGR00730 family Rossman fold protein [Chloroflexota bacterium]
MDRICVFCGSSPGGNPNYNQAAISLGQELARQRIGLVYGGGKVGMMGAIAQAVLESGGEVIGVIPEQLAHQEVAFTDLNDLRVVKTMHERKAMMVDLADGFIALPGGLGTFEEFFEVLTWAQLSIHKKPCGILNINGYYSDLIRFLDHAVSEQFIGNEHRSILQVGDQPAELLDKFNNYQAPILDKATWAKRLNNRPESS